MTNPDSHAASTVTPKRAAAARRAYLALLCCAWLALADSAAAAPGGPTAAEAPPAGARELVALPGGGWLALAARELQLVDARAAVRARWKVRGESLDARTDAQGRGLAVLVDSDTERVVPLRFDLGPGTLEPLAPLPPADPSIGAACLHRDAQGHMHVFVLASNGIAQQYVLSAGGQALAVRRFAVAPEAGACRVDDAESRLLVSDPGGVWAHPAQAEAPDRREPVALLRPHGTLRHGGGPLVVLPRGVAVVDGDRLAVFLRGTAGGWQAAPVPRLPWAPGTGIDALASRPAADGGGGGGTRVLARDEAAGQWRGLSLRTPAAAPSPPPLPIVQPRAQTVPVAQFGDAADDPAIWVDPRDTAASLVLGTDKKRGLAVYDLQGRETQFLAVGRLNNVDLRQDVRLGDERLDLAAATHRDDLAVVLFRIGADRIVSELARLPVGYPDIYGLCMRRTPDGQAEIFVNDKDGRTLHLRVERDSGGAIVGRRLREFRFDSQPEGCVVDDASGRLFAGEEKRGVWALSADPRDARGADRRMILPVGALLHADVEGLGVHREGGRAFLVVSSQGNDSYIVLDAAPPHAVRGAFRIGMDTQAGIDGASETDGLDVTALPLGPAFPKGLLVVQDGRKRLPEGPQNYKYVSWDDVARALALP